MSFDSLLNKKCTLQRRTTTQGSGGERDIVWNNYATNIKCRLAQASETQMSQEIRTADGKMVLATHILFMKPRNISEKNERAVIESNVYDIIRVSDGGGQGHHMELTLRRTFGG